MLQQVQLAGGCFDGRTIPLTDSAPEQIYLVLPRNTRRRRVAVYEVDPQSETRSIYVFLHEAYSSPFGLAEA